MNLPLNLDTDRIALPAARIPAKESLELLLWRRCSTRTFLPDPLTIEQVSALLWAAFGVNRAATGRRTAASAHNWQEVDIYAVFEEGAWRYDAPAHALELARPGDLRALTGLQDFVATAPLNLVYVADFSRMEDAHEDERRFFAGADAGLIAQNVYLYCAAACLGTVVRGLVDRRRLAPALGLAPTQHIALAQTVGLSPEIPH